MRIKVIIIIIIINAVRSAAATSLI